MRTTKTIEFNGAELLVKELTVAEVDALLNCSSSRATTIDRLFDDDFLTAEMIKVSTGLTPENLRKFGPSFLAPVVEAIKEVNPVFFRMARNEAKRAEDIAEDLLKKALDNGPAIS